jgi:hypothetical protein
LRQDEGVELVGHLSCRHTGASRYPEGWAISTALLDSGLRRNDIIRPVSL